MEMTKKEYIDKLKKELDTIEIRYQHLLNENCMIGEDFRSQARENKLYSDDLNEQIRRLKEVMKNMQLEMDDKDLQIIVWERKGEALNMNIEEYLTRYDLMRGERDQKIKDLTESSEATRNKENIIRALEEEINQMRYKDED